MPIRILNAEQVRQALPMADAVEAMKRAYAQLSGGQAHLPLRSRIGVEGADGVSLFMPAYLPEDDGLAVKIVSVFPRNPEMDLPTIYALVIALDPASGRPLAILEGASLTAIRTGAGSGAATDILARESAHSAAIIGSGVQARTQLEAICCVRQIDRVSVYSPNREHAEAFASDMAGVGNIPASITVAPSADEAVSQADIVCTATTATSPVFDGRKLRPGCHVNAVGSFTPDMVELDLETLKRAIVIVDSRQAALEEAGELIRPIRAGQYSESDIQAELGDILLGKLEGRTDGEQITLFKSVGVAVQDAAAAAVALKNAAAQDLGEEVDL